MWNIKSKQPHLRSDLDIQEAHQGISCKDFFLQLNKNTMHLVDDFYDKNVLFKDPIVEIHNREDLKNYYSNMYKNVDYITWELPDQIDEKNHTALTWRMTLKAKNFNGNNPVVVDGVSVIKFGGPEGKAVYHRDYFDLGEFVYEGLPLVGGIIRFAKKKMAGHKGEAS